MRVARSGTGEAAAESRLTTTMLTGRSSSVPQWRIVALALLVVAGACGDTADEVTTLAATAPNTTSPAAAPENTSPEVAPARQAYDAAGFLDVLAAAGVSIVDEAGAVVLPGAAPAGPVRLTRWQATALAREADLGVGIAASELDALVGEPLPGVPLSDLLAGYLIAADTPGGQWAARLIGPIDLAAAAEIRYPAAVLVVFVAEAARPGPADAVGTDVSEAGAVDAVYRPTPAAGRAEAVAYQVPMPDVGCALLAGQVQAQLELIFDWLALNPPPWLPAWVIAGGHAVIKSQLIQDWAFLIPGVALALAVLATVSLITAVVGSWSMSVVPSNPADRYSVGAEGPRAQTFTANLAGSPAWPPGLDECAASAGITLPDPTGAGTAVTWEVNGFPQFGTEDQRDTAFDGQGLARLEWHTGHEDSDAGQVQVGVVTAVARPDPAFREGLVQTADAAIKQMLAQAGPVAGGLGVVLPSASAIVASASQLIAQQASAKVEVQYHTEDCLTGTWVSVDYRASDQETLGGDGTVTLVFSDPAHGKVTFRPEDFVLARTLSEGSVWVKLVLSGGYTFTLDEAGHLTHTGGKAYLTPYAALGGDWIQTSEEPLLITEGGMGSLAGSTFTCNGKTLIVASAYSEFEFTKTG